MNIAHSIEELSFIEASGLTIGNFDGVHLGHQALIRHTLDVCAGEKLTPVVMTFWPHPRQVVMPQREHMPLTTREERFALLEALGVEHVLELPFTPELAAHDANSFVREFLAPLRLRHLIVGYDFSLGRDRGGGRGPALAPAGGPVVCRASAQEQRPRAFPARLAGTAPARR